MLSKLEKKYNKEIYIGKYGDKKIIDSLSELTAHNDHADRTIKKLNKTLWNT